ncbi:hypothetical protein L6164_030715 [Bauhinia variegata]|uniref:Uncharacterized protein n=1 Tax=Bauhinia variegata TaxID=167791 RepID=A0ACB9LD76_BAUVA|nr:hypothetical protein L6164_030715 [Bauhinia variegata]
MSFCPLHYMAASLTHPPLLPKHRDLVVRLCHKVPPSVLLLQMCHKFEEVRQLHAQFLVTGLLGHPLNAGRLIESYVEFSGINYAISVFETIPSPDIFAYNNIIRGLTLCKFPHEALLLFNKLLQEGRNPDSFTYTFVLKACSHLEVLSEGEQVHCHMIKAGVAMGTHITSSLIKMYTNADMIPCAERVLAELSQVKVPTFNSMLSGMYNDVKRGNWALRHLMDLAPQSGDRYKLAGLMFANAGVKENAYEIRKFMKENSLKSRRGLSYVQVQGKVHEFVAGDIIHNDVREIYRLWGGLTD